MNDQITLGQILEGDHKRDAVHVALAPVIAAEKLFPCQNIGVLPDGRAAASGTELIGIVDPFLGVPVMKGEQFWMVLYPNTITGLRHDWTHPRFDEKEQQQQEEKEAVTWLRGFAEMAGMTYPVMIERVEQAIDDGFPWTESGSEHARDAWYSLNEVDQKKFWQYMEEVTGQEISDDERGTPFSCSC